MYYQTQYHCITNYFFIVLQRKSIQARAVGCKTFFIASGCTRQCETHYSLFCPPTGNIAIDGFLIKTFCWQNYPPFNTVLYQHLVESQQGHFNVTESSSSNNVLWGNRSAIMIATCRQTQKNNRQRNPRDGFCWNGRQIKI